jgi:hypothetical protein
MVARLGAEVVLAVPATLRRLMGSLEGVGQVVSEDAAPPPFDLHCPLMSLPMAFGTTEATIPCCVPYLAADPDAVEQWRGIIPRAHDTNPVTVFGAAGLRVGLVWAGGSRPEQPHAVAIDRRRSMKLAEMACLAAVPGCVFVSMQVGTPSAQIGTAPFALIDVTGGLTDFADTAALIETLDLIISVDTAVAHLAGALGKPVWLLSRYDACWRWGRERDDTPWYPTMRLFRQTAPGDWAGVMRRVAEALPEFQVIG